MQQTRGMLPPHPGRGGRGAGRSGGRAVGPRGSDFPNAEAYMTGYGGMAFAPMYAQMAFAPIANLPPRGRGGRGQGAVRPRPPPTAADSVDLNGEGVLKVAGSSDAKALAGAIAKRMREGGQVKAVALGPASVNQAVKAMAIARSYLESDQLDLAVRPEFIHIPGKDASEPQRSALRFNILSRPPGQLRQSKEEHSELKVAAHTSPMSAAGAIAKRVRESQKCVLVAMGPESVNQAVKAIAIGRTYLEEDMLDINFKPRFIHLEVEKEENAEKETKSAVEMTILINQL